MRDKDLKKVPDLTDEETSELLKGLDGCLTMVVVFTKRGKKKADIAFGCRGNGDRNILYNSLRELARDKGPLGTMARKAFSDTKNN